MLNECVRLVQNNYVIFTYNELSLIINNIIYFFIINNIIKIRIFLVTFKIQIDTPLCISPYTTLFFFQICKILFEEITS